MTAAEVRVVTSVALATRLILDGASWWKVDRAKRDMQAAIDELGPVPFEVIRDLLEIGEHCGTVVPL